MMLTLPTERELLATTPNLLTAERTLWRFGAVLVTTTAGPDWLELSVWTRGEH